MSVALRHDEEYRALQLFDRIPAGHVGVIVAGTDWDPHLMQGEVAIVDTTDKSREFGELFVVTLSEGTPHEKLAIVQLLREEPIIGWTGFWYGFGLPGTGQMIEGRRRRYVDGPLAVQYWAEKCLGRIVGVMRPRSSQPPRLLTILASHFGRTRRFGRHREASMSESATSISLSFSKMLMQPPHSPLLTQLRCSLSITKLCNALLFDGLKNKIYQKLQFFAI